MNDIDLNSNWLGYFFGVQQFTRLACIRYFPRVELCPVIVQESIVEMM